MNESSIIVHFRLKSKIDLHKIQFHRIIRLSFVLCDNMTQNDTSRKSIAGSAAIKFWIFYREY